MEQHGHHIDDQRLDEEDGAALDQVDGLMELVTELAGPEPGQPAMGPAEVAGIVDEVLEGWYADAHPRLFGRLEKLKVLEREVPILRGQLETVRVEDPAHAKELAGLREQLKETWKDLNTARAENATLKKQLKPSSTSGGAESQKNMDRMKRAMDKANALHELAQEEIATLKQQLAQGGGGAVMEFEARIAELTEQLRDARAEVEHLKDEVTTLENEKASLYEEAQHVQAVERRVEELEAEKESLSHELDAVQDEHAAVQEELVEALREVEELSSHQSDPRVRAVPRVAGNGGDLTLVQSQEVQEELEGDAILMGRIRELEAVNRSLQSQLDRERRHSAGSGGSEGSRGATRPESMGRDDERYGVMARRIADLEEAAQIALTTNELLMRERAEEVRELNDLRAETRAMRYATLENPPASRRPVGQETELAELAELRKRNRELRLYISRNTKNKTTSQELQAQLLSAQEDLITAEAAVATQKAAIVTAEEERRAGLKLPDFAPDLSLEERLALNDQIAARNKELNAAILRMNVELEEIAKRVPVLKSKVTRLRKQVVARRAEEDLLGPEEEQAEELREELQAEEELREEEEELQTEQGAAAEYLLEEEAAKRTKTIQARLLGAKVLVF